MSPEERQELLGVEEIGQRAHLAHQGELTQLGEIAVLQDDVDCPLARVATLMGIALFERPGNVRDVEHFKIFGTLAHYKYLVSL